MADLLYEDNDVSLTRPIFFLKEVAHVFQTQIREQIQIQHSKLKRLTPTFYSVHLRKNLILSASLFTPYIYPPHVIQSVPVESVEEEVQTCFHQKLTKIFVLVSEVYFCRQLARPASSDNIFLGLQIST